MAGKGNLPIFMNQPGLQVNSRNMQGEINLEPTLCTHHSVRPAGAVTTPRHNLCAEQSAQAERTEKVNNCKTARLDYHCGQAYHKKESHLPLPSSCAGRGSLWP